jgi:hypothetical protein
MVTIMMMVTVTVTVVVVVSSPSSSTSTTVPVIMMGGRGEEGEVRYIPPKNGGFLHFHQL